MCRIYECALFRVHHRYKVNCAMFQYIVGFKNYGSMSERLLHPRRRQVQGSIERLIRVTLYFIQAQLGAGARATIEAVGFHRPEQPAGSSDRRDRDIEQAISGSRDDEQSNNMQTTNRPAASCDSRSQSWFSKLIKLCRKKKHTERDVETGLVNGSSDDEPKNNETTEDERAREATEESSGGAEGLYRPEQPAGSSDRRDGYIELPISGTRDDEQSNNMQTTNRPAASCDSRSQSWFSKLIKLCRKKKHTERDVEIGLVNGSSDDEQTNNETTEDERAHEATEDSSWGKRWNWRWKTPFYILVTFTFAGIPLLLVYLYQTCGCAHYKHLAHYHCVNGTFPHGIPQNYALSIEISFALLQLSCRAIFVAFCFRQTGCEGFKIFLKKVVLNDREYTLPLFGYYLACVVRFAFLLWDEVDMGQYKDLCKALISLYIIDDLGILIVVYTLNYVKIKDLSENKRVQRWFTFVLYSFWLQFFAYWFISVIQLFFGLVAPNVPLPGSAYNVLTTWGQFVYLYRIRNCLWHKLNDDEEPAIGVKSSDKKK